jgi:hypothetical protein
MKFRHLLAAAAMTVTAPALLLQACATSNPEFGEPNAGPSTGAGTDTQSQGVCLLNNCKSDAECGGCADGRNKCKVEENRCVACDPVSGKGCKDGESCTSFGLCAPKGQKCETDDHGVPKISCNSDSDCKACDPMHQVCANNKCVACADGKTQHCLQSDICVNNNCSPKCPKSCESDGDCSQCGGPGNETHACNAHKCAECSDTVKCKNGLQCQNGTCVPGCGIPNSTPGDCTSDEDCKFCGDSSSQGSYVCKKAINANKPQDHGSCVPKAQGCSDLGKGVAVLPAPFNQVTNSCSSDANCANVDIQLNVGKLIRDAVGSDSIDVGFKKIKIQDANVAYGMNKCAKIDITESISCGVCVPCKVDSDCKPIAVDPLVLNLFKGDPVAQIAGSLLINLLYGQNQSHDLNFFCQPVAAGYGVCAPCSNPTQACGKSGGSVNNGSGPCAHSVCTAGEKLNCSDACVAKVCAQDDYCCKTAWDSQCVSEVSKFCGSNVCGNNGGNNGGGSSCAHSECKAGAKLTSACSPCAAAVCKADPYCCNNDWDNQCVTAAKNNKSCSCG